MNTQSMNSYERVMAAFQGFEFDVVPAVNFTSVVTLETLQTAKISFANAHQDAFCMASLTQASMSMAGFDSLAPYFSVLLEAAALGATIDWGTDTITPHVIKTAYSSLDELEIPHDFLNRFPMNQLLRCIKILSKRYKNNVPIIGKVIGPWTLAYNLYGVEKLTLDMILEPEKTKQAIRELSIIPITFAKAQFDAGADAIVWAEHATSDIVSEKIYREFILPIHQNATTQLSNYGPTILHICGVISDRFDDIAESGFNCLHIDSRNPISSISARAEGKIRLVSCINNPITLLRGNTTLIKKEVRESIQNHITMIGPECAIPVSVPLKNLRILTNTVHSYRYQDLCSISPYYNSIIRPV